jgi:hypothetical protein
MVSATVAAVALLAVMVPSAGAQDPEFVPGSANASAQIVRLRLFYAGFGLEMSAGTSIASYRNQTAKASSSTQDLRGVTGLAGVPAPAPTSASSTNGDEHVEEALTDPPLFGRTLADATKQPASTASVDLASIQLPGLLEVEGGTTSAHTELVAGSHRVATASAEVAAVSLAGGLVELRGLRWTATQRTGTDALAEADFDLAAIAIAGVEIPIDGELIADVLRLVNDALAPIGLVLEPPEVLHLPDGSIDITSLRIGIANSPLGAQLIAPLVSAVRPLLLPLLGLATNINPQLGLLGLVLDLGLGVVDGSGGIVLSIGGANAGTDDTTFADLLGRPAPLAPAAPPAPAPAPAPAPTFPAVSTPTLAAPPVAAPAAAAPPAAIVQSGPLECVLAASPQRHGSCRGANAPAAFALIAITLAGLGLLEVRARRRTLLPVVEGASQ